MRSCMRLAPRLLVIPCILAACGSDEDTGDGAAASRPAQVSLSSRPPVAEVSERFLSVAVDTAQVVGGAFWAADGEVSVIGSESRPVRKSRSR